MVSAVERVHQYGGEYLKSLDECAPDLSWLPSGANLHYRATEHEYSITLDYTPSWPQPGRSSCHRASTSPEWTCHGYY